ncbi:unnamed protein product, partial [Anisakis simplex]|uniref:Transposase n=1 Tax=Anisakis simplex TaxID=6269 RepID=A0A0M3JJV1_ANISI
MECVYNGLKGTVGGVHREMKDELDAINKKMEKTDTILKGLGTI